LSYGAVRAKLYRKGVSCQRTRFFRGH